jgi:plasmid stability protein
MGQVLIRNLDDEMVEEFRISAKANGRSLEAELREVLKRGRPNRVGARRELAMRVRSQLPDPTPGPEGTEIIRWYRDTNGGRDPDAF